MQLRVTDFTTEGITVPERFLVTGYVNSPIKAQKVVTAVTDR
jgi:hypothetical protein